MRVPVYEQDKPLSFQEELLNWIKNFNPGLNTEHWGVLDKQSDPILGNFVPNPESHLNGLG
jgi:hypothetical protein